MKYTHVTSLLVAVVTATPIQPAPNSPPKTFMIHPESGSYYSNQTLSMCEAAPNCETYEHEVFGRRIRFVPGMEPGSDHYKRHVKKRALVERDTTTTYITVGDNSLDYGSTGAAGVYGVIHHLYDTCHEASCDNNPYEVSSWFASPTNAYQANILINPEGQYDGWDERNAFVDTAVAVASQGQTCQTKDWGNGGGVWGGGATGSVTECTQTNYINVSRWSAPSGGYLMGFVQVRAQLEDTSNGWCSGLLAALAGIAGIVAGMEGGGLVGGSAAAFFGAIPTPFCGS